ncbi:MAG: cytochrome c biogenesis protein CcsA [Sutterellaceae bacterium]|nr:cytochrome c biogenesis protein CcsA [Sutterellaceae bacterium]MDD7441138.1 cytochrome c biogenesis protein CcsA [Sutterellaceae bacterium]MDY2867469.1 cytochrome c biogenesis protein CcsA [Mesosutterella sp.]
MENGILLPVLAAIVYSCTGAFALSTLWKRGGRAPAWLLCGIALALVLHALALRAGMFSSGEVRFGFGLALSSAMFFSVASLSVGAFFHRLGPVLGISSVIAGVAALLPLAFPGEVMPPRVWTPLFQLHLLIALLTYGLLAVDIVQAALLEFQNRTFRYSSDPVPQTGILSTLPPILMMEKVFFYILGAAFVTLTMLLVTGCFVTEENYGTLFHLDHKTFTTWIAWLLCAMLLAGRRFFGWRGTKAVRCFWALCAVYAVAYLGYAFVIEQFIA